MTEKEFLSKRHMVYDNFQLPHCDEEHKRAVARFYQVCKDAQIAAKVDRAVELVERIAATRSRPIPDAENAGPSVSELLAEYQPSADDQARICAEAEAAYAARNPHKKDGLYENEGKVTKPANYFADAAPVVSFKRRCQEVQAAYAARNPHKREAAAR